MYPLWEILVQKECKRYMASYKISLTIKLDYEMDGILLTKKLKREQDYILDKLSNVKYV